MGKHTLLKRTGLNVSFFAASQIVVGYNLFDHNFSIDRNVGSWVLAILLTSTKR